jgi:dihydrofolate synthase/folylpolyglutamate synthase
MIYSDALTYLGQARRFGMKLGLEPMRELARTLGSPQDRLRFIHLAGTNGKGSTAAFCESCLRAAGFRVGLYTSPHLVSVRERIQIDREMISEADFGEGMAVVQKAAQAGHADEATFFEIMTALALWYFDREKVDWVVWETGLGGRYDATNIVTPEICIITNIGLDHQQYLGPTVVEIAAEKAGIIKPGVPVITAVESDEVVKVIRRKAMLEHAPLTIVPQEIKVKNRGLRGAWQTGAIDGKTYKLGLSGPHQVANAACAVVALQKIAVCPDRDVLARGLAQTQWAGRFQVVSETPLVVLDGAHNPAAARMLVKTWDAFLRARFGWNASRGPVVTNLVFGAVGDKDISEMADLLRPLAQKVSLVRLANERGADPQLLAPAFAGLPVTCYDSVAEAWANIIADQESTTLVTGSLFLIGEMLARRQGIGEEYRLNERLEKLAAHTITR